MHIIFVCKGVDDTNAQFVNVVIIELKKSVRFYTFFMK